MIFNESQDVARPNFRKKMLWEISGAYNRNSPSQATETSNVDGGRELAPLNWN